MASRVHGRQSRRLISPDTSPLVKKSQSRQAPGKRPVSYAYPCGDPLIADKARLALTALVLEIHRAYLSLLIADLSEMRGPKIRRLTYRVGRLLQLLRKHLKKVREHWQANCCNVAAGSCCLISYANQGLKLTRPKLTINVG